MSFFIIILIIIIIIIIISFAELDGVYKSEGWQFYHNRQSWIYQYNLTF